MSLREPLPASLVVLCSSDGTEKCATVRMDVLLLERLRVRNCAHGGLPPGHPGSGPALASSGKGGRPGRSTPRRLRACCDLPFLPGLHHITDDAEKERLLKGYTDRASNHLKNARSSGLRALLPQSDFRHLISRRFARDAYSPCGG